MSKQVQVAVVLLLVLGVALAFIPEESPKDPEVQFLEQAIACHRESRPGLEQMLSIANGIWQVSPFCEGSGGAIANEISSGAIQVLRSTEHDYFISFTPQRVQDRVEWVCQTNLRSNRFYCQDLDAIDISTIVISRTN